MSEATSRGRLDTPRTSRRPRWNVDTEAVGRFSEAIARFLGTGRFLLWQTVFVVVWIALNLAFSTQAAYAAPLILLAQNRQENRDRVSLEEDRRRAEQTKADTEYLARELAALRLAVGEVATRDYLRRELEELRERLDPPPKKKSSARKQDSGDQPSARKQDSGEQPSARKQDSGDQGMEQT
jgi:uncharacterized membrane protein